jgi:hypothetical protein
MQSIQHHLSIISAASLLIPAQPIQQENNSNSTAFWLYLSSILTAF